MNFAIYYNKKKKEYKLNIKDELKFIEKCKSILERLIILEDLIEKYDKNKNYKLMRLYHRAENRYLKIYSILKQREILRTKRT